MQEVFKNKIGRVVSPGKIDFIERDVEAPLEDEVIIKVKASAICGSDLHIYKGKHPSVTLPATIGHEFSGVVVEVGSGVKDVALGERVTLEPCIVCGKCDACLHGEYSFCENISFTYRNGDGAMAEYVKAKASHIFKLPEDVSFEEGCLIEPMSVAVHAVRRADIKLGESVLILGAGAIGLLIAAVCRINGAGDITVVDFAKDRLALAKEYGATYTVCPSEQELAPFIAQITGGRGVDKSFECVGRESTLTDAMINIKKNGLATVVGIFEQQNVTVPVGRFVTHEIKVQGAQSYCWDFPIALQFCKRIDLTKLITHRFALDRLDKAFEACFDKTARAIKAVILP